MKKKIIWWRVALLVAILISDSLCLNVAIYYTDQPAVVRWICGIIGGLLFLSVFMLPYLVSKRVRSKYTLLEYLKSLWNEDEC